jgi:hypothetical protein
MPPKPKQKQGSRKQSQKRGEKLKVGLKEKEAAQE